MKKFSLFILITLNYMLLKAQWPDVRSFNTGTNSTFSGTITRGNSDLNWKVRERNGTSNPWSSWTNAIVVGNLAPGTNSWNWVNSPWNNCAWISHNSNGVTPLTNNTYYEYKLSFNLPNCNKNLINSYFLDMNMFADNCIIDVKVNGVTQVHSNSITSGIPNSVSCFGWQGNSNPFTIRLINGFTAGTNEIVVTIYDFGGVSGFLAQIDPKGGSFIIPKHDIELCNTAHPFELDKNYKWNGEYIEGEFGNQYFNPKKSGNGIFVINSECETYIFTVIDCCEDPCSWSKSGNQNITPKNYIGPKNNADLNFKIEDKLRMRLTKNDANKIGHLTLNSGSSLMFGSLTESNTENRWGIEDYDEGLNFWKPWPSSFSGNYKVHIHDMGHVSIGKKSNPWVQKSTGWFGTKKVQNFKLQVHGNAISDQWFQWSDEKIKTNVTSNKDVLENISKLQSISYNYDIKKLNEHFDIDNKKEIEKSDLDILLEEKRGLVKHFGFTAQNVEEIYPNLVDEIAGLKVVNYVGLIPLLTQAIKELNTKIEKQNNVVIENEELKAIISKLELRIVKQEQKLALLEKSISLLCESGCAGLEKVKQNADDADVLYQSIPNPTDNEALINFYLSKKYNNASIQINSLEGKSMKTIVLDASQGKGSVKIQLGQYAAQTYFYSLIVDNKVVDTKKLTVIR